MTTEINSETEFTPEEEAAFDEAFANLFANLFGGSVTTPDGETSFELEVEAEADVTVEAEHIGVLVELIPCACGIPEVGLSYHDALTRPDIISLLEEALEIVREAEDGDFA